MSKLSDTEKTTRMLSFVTAAAMYLQALL